MLKNCNLLSLQMVRVVSPAGETGMLVVDSVVISGSKHVFIIPIIALHIVLCHSTLRLLKLEGCVHAGA